LENTIELLPDYDDNRKEVVFGALEDVKRFSRNFKRLGAATRLECKSENLISTLKHALSAHEAPGVAILINGTSLRSIKTNDNRFEVVADHRKLADALDELASNSIRCRNKHTDVHHISIRIDREERPAGPVVGMMGMMMYVPVPDPESSPAKLRIIFEDNGPGISKSLRPKLFQPFESGRPQSSGLGLAIVKGVIESHGGRIALTSPPSSGARFEITIPVNRKKKSK